MCCVWVEEIEWLVQVRYSKEKCLISVSRATRGVLKSKGIDVIVVHIQLLLCALVSIVHWLMIHWTFFDSWNILWLVDDQPALTAQSCTTIPRSRSWWLQSCQIRHNNWVQRRRSPEIDHQRTRSHPQQPTWKRGFISHASLNVTHHPDATYHMSTADQIKVEFGKELIQHLFTKAVWYTTFVILPIHSDIGWIWPQ